MKNTEVLKNKKADNEKAEVFKVHYKDHKPERLGRTEVKEEEYTIK